jgi:hypothetical protein
MYIKKEEKSKEFVDNCKNFVLDFLVLAEESYFGDFYYKNKENLKKHAAWCLLEISKKLNVKPNDEGIKRLIGLLNEHFYFQTSKTERITDLVEHYTKIFDTTIKRSQKHYLEHKNVLEWF